MAASTNAALDLSAALVLAPPAAWHWLVILPVVVSIAASAVLAMIRRRGALGAALAIAALVVLVLLQALLLWKVAAQGPVTMVMGRWLAPFGIAFTVDLTGALFALAAAIAALAAGVHALADIDAAGRGQGFFAFLLLLTAGVSGALMTGDIFNLYVWFEVTLIAAFGLMTIGDEPDQIAGAWTYAVLNLLGTALFLSAVGLLYAVFGTLNIADLVGRIAVAGEDAPLVTLTTLFLLAIGVKAAAFPVHFWLPAAYHTPKTTVSALFAGLLTKVAVYVLIRLLVMVLPLQREELSLLIVLAGAATILLGALGMLAQDDIRRMAGFAVIGGIGNMLVGLALGSPGGVSGAIFYALHAMMAMTALYIAIGQAGRLGGGFSLSRLGGLYGRCPWFAYLTLALLFAVSGLPPFSGFWPKVILVKASLDIGAWWLAGIILAGGFLTTIALVRVFLLACWRPRPDEAPATAAIAWPAALPLVVLTGLVVGFGLFPESLLRLVQDAAAGLANPESYILSVFPQGGPS